MPPAAQSRGPVHILTHRWTYHPFKEYLLKPHYVLVQLSLGIHRGLIPGLPQWRPNPNAASFPYIECDICMWPMHIFLYALYPLWMIITVEATSILSK